MPVQDVTGGYVETAAELSECGKYRYTLTRTWDDRSRRCVFVMLNPSTADATADDPTIRRCTGFARSWGYGGYTVVNLFAFRATDPAEMLAFPFPVGPDNDARLLGAFARAAGNEAVVVAAWGGSHRRVMERAFAVRCMAARAGIPLHAIRLSGKGVPCHPLYLPGDLTPVPYPHPGESGRG